jgi:hypothetical protein
MRVADRTVRRARTAAVSAVLGAAVGAALLTASPAAANQVETDVIVSPERQRPGHSVRVTASDCITDNPDAVAEAYSDVFQTIVLEPHEGGKPGSVSGIATVFHHARPGTYNVNVACDVTRGASGSGSLTVIG